MSDAERRARGARATARAPRTPLEDLKFEPGPDPGLDDLIEAAEARPRQPGHSKCAVCGGWAVDGSMCPQSIECPTCGAQPGRPCKRPSGHRAQQLHQLRWLEAEAIDARKGIRYETTWQGRSW